MRIASRRIVTPAVIGVSAAAIAQMSGGVAIAAPWSAAHQGSAAGHGSPSLDGTTASASPATATTGCTESSSPDYGCGKITVEAQPVVGTYPATAAPDLSGLTFDITGNAADQNTVHPNATTTCTTGESGSAATNECTESVASQQPSGAPDPYATWVAGAQYTVALDTTGSNKAAPANSIVAGLTGSFPDCTAYQTSTTNQPTGCPDGAVVNFYGTYHRIGLHIVNRVTHKGVAGVTYKLCSPTPSSPVLTGSTCPSGSSLLTQATTDSAGKLAFTDVYAGSPNYTVVLARRAHGYRPAHIQQLDVPVVTTPAQSGKLVQGVVKLTPIKTRVKTQRVSTTAGKTISFNAFKGAARVVKPMKLVKLGKPHHGTSRHIGGRIVYRPAKAFTGKDVFTYTVRNGVGVKSTGKVVVHVKG